MNLNLNKPAWLLFNFLSLSWRIDPRTRDISKELKGASVLFVWRREREISLKALELSPDDSVLIKGNLAHAYIFDNQFETAKTIYLENKDAKLDEERSFCHAVLDDFKKLEEAGITHPDTEKIKALPHH